MSAGYCSQLFSEPQNFIQFKNILSQEQIMKSTSQPEQHANLKHTLTSKSKEKLAYLSEKVNNEQCFVEISALDQLLSAESLHKMLNQKNIRLKLDVLSL